MNRIFEMPEKCLNSFDSILFMTFELNKLNNVGTAYIYLKPRSLDDDVSW